MNSLTIIVLSTLFSAFFSGMEIAFVSANKLRLELDKKQSVSTSKIINIFANNPSQYLATMLIGNNIALVVFGLIMAIVLEPYIAQYTSNDSLILFTQTVISTIIILFSAEFLPKTLFKINANHNLKIFAFPTYFFYLLFYPVARFSIFLSKKFIKNIMRVNLPADGKLAFGKSDLNNLVNEITDEDETNGELDHDVKIFQNALDFSNIKLRECVVPRTELIAVPISEDVEKLRQLFIETGHSKILIYENSIDNIIGYAHSITLFENPPSLKSMLRKIPIVPETMPANKLLQLFTKKRKNMALVVDEFGGTSGIVTMEDILEEIIGDIQDEHDKVTLVDKQINDTVYQFSGRFEIDDINEKYNLNLPASDEYETIAGLILAQFGSIPKVNDIVEFPNFSIKVLEATTTKVELIELKIS